VTRILWFSGTGNTFWSARRMAELLGRETEMSDISAEMRKPPGVLEAEKTAILFPAYAYQAPLMVRRFLLRTEIRSPWIGAFVTYGSDPGGSLAEIYRVLKKKKRNLSCSGRIPAVENYIPIFGPPSEALAARRLSMQREATEEAARAVREGRVNRLWPWRPLSAFVSSLFRGGKTLFLRGYRLLPECNGCGLCEKICPARAIRMEKGRPVFFGDCEHCQACLNWCPRRAISYMRLTPSTPRWQCPGVQAAELFRDAVERES
jgi:ferredoxin